MQTLKRIVFVVTPLLVGLVVATNSARAVAQTVQLPVIGVRGVRTAVFVPDGGTINLGGVGRSSYGQSRQSGFGRFPSSNRFGAGGPRSGASLSAKIIRLKDLERRMLADHAARRPQAGDVHLNGSHAVQAKADFISRNVGR